MARVRLGNRYFTLPRNRMVRMTIGVLLIIGGMLGFMPVLGFWMLPLGFIVLATDVPALRRFNRRVAVAVKRWWKGTKRRTNSPSP